MTFLPIVARELRVAARRRATFLTRTIVAVIAIAIGVFLYLANIDSPAELLSQRIFSSLVGLSLLFALLAGRRSTADCLSEEKREGTLGLLFLTDLKGYDIVLGKLTATSVNGFYSLLAVFPVLAVPLLIGGITNGEFWRVVLVLANTFIFSLSVGMLVSALSREARRAMGANLLLLLLIIGIPGATAAALSYFLPSHVFYQPLLLSCPLYSLYLSDDSLYKFHKSEFWTSLILLHALTWILLASAAWAVRRAWQDKPDGKTRFTLREAWREWRFGRASTKLEHRRKLLNINAFYWLAARSRFKPHQVWVLFLFIAAWWVWARFQFGTLWLSDATSGTDLATAIMLNVALKLWIGLEACRPLAEERKAGALELLLSTPLTVRDVLHGQWLALKRQFLLPAVFGLLVVVAFMLNAISHSPADENLIVAGWLGGIVLFLADVAALTWAAMGYALTTQGTNQAAVSAISRVIIAPSVALAAIAMLANVSAFTSNSSEPSVAFYVVCWLGLGFAADLAYGLTARHRLLTRFRELACENKPKKLA